jgi:hypothetical protein
MKFRQWWRICMLPAFNFQLSFLSLSKTDGTGNATTA